MSSMETGAKSATKPISNPGGTPQTLIHDPKVRENIHLEKQAKVLQWLKTEIYSSGALLGQVMGVQSRQAIHKALSRMQEDGLIRAGLVRTIAGRQALWGITEHGQAMAFDPAQEKAPSAKVFQLGAISVLRLQHTLTLQAMKLDAMAKGWTAWRNCDREVRLKSRNNRLQHRADVIAIHPAGRIIAVELELTFKSVKRYAEDILPDHVRNIYVEDQYQHVLWVCPNQQDESRMRKLLDRALEQMKKKDTQAASRYDAYREQSGVKNVFFVSNLEQWAGFGKTTGRTERPISVPDSGLISDKLPANTKTSTSKRKKKRAG